MAETTELRRGDKIRLSVDLTVSGVYLNGTIGCFSPGSNDLTVYNPDHFDVEILERPHSALRVHDVIEEILEDLPVNTVLLSRYGTPILVVKRSTYIVYQEGDDYGYIRRYANEHLAPFTVLYLPTERTDGSDG